MSSQQYYQTEGRHGEYQYVLLKDIVNNFMLMNVGDDKIINDAQRYQVVHLAKRGLQELSYDALRENVRLEFELGNNLKVIMPEDFVSVVQVSWLDNYGRLHPLTKGRTTDNPDAYLQDEDSNYLYSESGELQEAQSLTEQRSYTNEQKSIDYIHLEDEHTGGRFGMDTASANFNGTYTVDKKEGFIRFSSHFSDGDLVVIEYVSDGLFGKTDSEIRVNKFAEAFMYSYIQSEILDKKFGVQEYIVRRAKKDTSAKLRNAKIRLMNIDKNDLIQSLKGKNKWIK